MSFDGKKVLFLPYQEKTTMGEVVFSQIRDSAKPDLLISHGDYISGSGTSFGYSGEGYFLLTQADFYKIGIPSAVLGHIHQPPAENGTVYYTGSPWPVSGNETGKRRYLKYSTSDGSISKKDICVSTLYERPEVISIPGMYPELLTSIKNIISSYDRIYSPDEKKLLNITLKVLGYTDQDKSIIKKDITGLFDSADMKLDAYKDTNLTVNDNSKLRELSKKAFASLELLSLEPADFFTTKDMIKQKILSFIYSGQA
jgi:DNA repair exonuclease SbcCD nuclease subunit